MEMNWLYPIPIFHSAWDTDDIDHWKIDEFKPEDNGHSFTEESSFATLFPKYRENYLKEVWPHVTRALEKLVSHSAFGMKSIQDLFGITIYLSFFIGCWLCFGFGWRQYDCEDHKKDIRSIYHLESERFDQAFGKKCPIPPGMQMLVYYFKQWWLVIIVLCKFLQAVKILDDGVACDIIKIGNVIRNKERFVKRRQRLLGPNGSTLKVNSKSIAETRFSTCLTSPTRTKAIELLTKCYMMVQGNTVSAMGPYKGLKEIRRIIIDCMKNVHPIYHIKVSLTGQQNRKRVF